jgi:hypothetical protein
MAGRGIQFAGDYNIKEIKLFTSSGNVIDLSEAVITMNIYEDIFSPSITGTLGIVDTNAIIMNAPITGQDYLSFKITTPGLENQSIDFTENVMSIYRIDTRVSVSSGTEVFTLHFCSPEGLRDNRVRVSKSYTKSIDNIVKDVLTSKFYINSNKDLFIEPTVGIKKMVVPNMHPFKLINQLKREAQAEYNGSPHYLFYENINGIHFRSLDSLYAQKEIGTYHSGDAGTIDFKKGGFGNVEYELKRVLDYQFNSNNDTLKNIAGGMLASSILSHDIYNKSYSYNDFDYINEFQEYDRVNGNALQDNYPIYNEVALDEFDNTISQFPDSRIHLHPTSTVNGADAQHYDYQTNTYPYTPNKIDETYLSRQSKFMELNDGASITMEINGTTTVYAGSIINFDMPINGTDHEGDKTDKYYSGRYLIQSTRHMFDQKDKRHTIMMNLVKDSLNSELPINQLAIEPKGKKGIVVNDFYNKFI